MAPIQLLDLPVEILTKIVSELRQNDKEGPVADVDCEKGWTSTSSQTDLTALATTCKILNSIAIPILYYAPTTYCHPLLLRTLAGRPDLAALVHALDRRALWRFRHISCESCEHGGIFTDLDHGLIKAAAQRFNITLQSDWAIIPESNFTKGDAHFHLLLAVVADNIEALRDSFDPHAKGPGVLSGSTVTFPRLSFIALSDDNAGEHCYDLKSYKDFLDRCPNLETLWILGCEYVPEDFTHLGKLRSLRFTEYNFDLPNLENILRACPNLEELCLSRRYDGCWSGGLNEKSFSIQGMVDLLKPLAKTLRCLVLDLGYNDERDLESLAGLDSLETLVMPSGYFLNSTPNLPRGTDHPWRYPTVYPPAHRADYRKLLNSNQLADMLPKSLKHLALSIWLNRWDPPPTQLVTAINKSLFPQLEWVDFGVSYGTKYPEDDGELECDDYTLEWERFEASIVAAGIPCIVFSERSCPAPKYSFIPGKHFLRPNHLRWGAWSA